MRGFGAKIILDWADNDRISALKQWTGWELKVGGESRVKGRNKYLIKLNKFALNEKANGR